MKYLIPALVAAVVLAWFHVQIESDIKADLRWMRERLAYDTLTERNFFRRVKARYVGAWAGMISGWRSVTK